MNLPAALGLAYGAAEFALARGHRSSGGKRSDRGSLRWIWIAAIVGAVSATLIPQVAARGGFALGRIGVATALALFASGVLVRVWSIRALGRWFTVDVATRDDQALVTSGPYRFVRHPSYTGALLCFVGWGLTYEHALSFAAIVVPVTVALAYRIHVEEQALAARFGDAWSAFAARTKRLVPGIY